MKKSTVKNCLVDAMTNLGAGVVKNAGEKIIFVNGGVTGDCCDVEITSEKRSFMTGRISNLISPSEFRRNVDCTAFENGCGGCAFRHISYDHELSVKQEYVSSLFRKAHLDVTVEKIRSAGENAPRTKVTVPFSENYDFGYYKENSHSVIPCSDCHLHDDVTNNILKKVSELAKKYTFQGLHHVTVRRAFCGTMLIFISSDISDKERAVASSDEIMQNFDDIKSIYFCLSEKDSLRGTYHLLRGEERIKDRLTNCDFLISPDAFYQVNHNGAEILYTLAKDFADLHDGESIADLYCGTGTIGLSIIKNSRVRSELLGIEIVKSAVEDAVLNAKANGIEARFICEDAASYTSSADIVILDPPRSGCSEKLLCHLHKIAPDRIVYVSCDPATLVRDCKILSDIYRIEKVVPVDMFPRTGHVECVVLMTKEHE